MTKQELLSIMEKWGACREATEFVKENAKEDAAEIVATCSRADWLIWLLGRERLLVGFSRACASRAAAFAASVPSCLDAADAAARAASRAANRAADHASPYAAFAAEAAAAHAARSAVFASAYAQEKERQLLELQRIGRDWANGDLCSCVSS